MAESLATQASRGHRTLCLPFEEESYRRVVADPAEFRRVVDACFRDANRYCADEIPEGDMKVLGCLKTHRAKLSKACE